LLFQRELKNRQRIKIKTWVDSYPGKVGKLVQQMVDEQENVCCEAVFKIGLFDLAARKLILPDAAWLQAMGLTGADLKSGGAPGESSSGGTPG
jgi:acyl-CoA thioesterase FadM